MLPEDIVERLKKEPMTWPDPQKIQPGEKRIGAIKFTWLNYFSANPIKIHDLQYNSKI